MQNIEDVPYSTCGHESDVSSNIHIHTCINNKTQSHTLAIRLHNMSSYSKHIVGPHVQWDLSNVVTYETSCTYSGTCLMWSPMGPHVPWNL